MIQFVSNKVFLCLARIQLGSATDSRGGGGGGSVKYMYSTCTGVEVDPCLWQKPEQTRIKGPERERERELEKERDVPY